jgi:hypothetical protein
VKTHHPNVASNLIRGLVEVCLRGVLLNLLGIFLRRTAWIQSLFLWVLVSTSWNLPLYASLHQ